MNRYRIESLICLSLGAITVACLGHTCANNFINYDDPMYVTANPHLHKGLTLAGIQWAFTDTNYHMWNPLTRISFLADFQFHGLRPAGYHLTNLLLHLANVLLLFLWLRSITGAVWRCAAVAAFFAVHPLRVESVAWITERKDVLSSFFGLLTLWGYTHYVKRPSWGRYLGLVAAFVLSLLAKPMLVTLPLMFLLLDFWPLGRLTTKGTDNNLVPAWRRLLLEKLPLIAVAAAFGVMTIFVHKSQGTDEALEYLAPKYRLGNALVAYVQYLKMTFWPTGLAIPYPHPETNLTLAEAAGAGVFLVILSALVVRGARRYPYVLVGWLWFLGTLVPVLGLVAVGIHVLADRYTYVPHMGLFLGLVWFVGDLWMRWQRSSPRSARNLPLLLGSGLVAGGLGACMFLTFLQVRYWRDSQTLWTHAVAVTKGNYVAHNNLATILEEQGDLESARRHFAQAWSLHPNCPLYCCNLAKFLTRQNCIVEAEALVASALAENPENPLLLTQKGDLQRALGRFAQAKEFYLKAVKNQSGQPATYHGLGVLLAEEGNLESARECFTQALDLQPDAVESLDSLGLALFRLGKTDQAVATWQEALRINPSFADTHFHLGLAHAEAGRLEAAQQCYAEALRCKPEHAEAHFALALLLEKEGKLEQGETACAAAVHDKPDWLQARVQLGWFLLQAGKTEPALTQFRKTLELRPNLADAHNGLGLAEVQRKNYSEAGSHFARAVALHPANPTFRFNLALALIRDGRPLEAHPHLVEVLRLAPDHPGARQTLADIQAHLSNSVGSPDQK